LRIDRFSLIIVVQSIAMKKKLFISYTSADTAFKNEFDIATAVMRRMGLFETWQMGMIVPNQEWDLEVQKNLEAADIVVFLLSPRFFASAYIWEHEFMNTLARWERKECQIAGIVLSKCDWQLTRLKDIQLLRKGREIDLAPNRDEAWMEVVNDLRRML
jgi:hypothetical protein